MPTQLKRHDEPGHIHFWTISCYRRLAFFWEDSLKQIVIDGLRDLQTRHGICLIAYVVMPEHVHINLFDPSTLTAMLAKCSFTNIQAGSYTHYRYDTWTRRPELQGWIQRLPGFMAWRINRTLGSLDRFGRWGDLRTAGPTSLEEANRCVTTLGHQQPLQTSKQTADNLTATAHRT